MHIKQLSSVRPVLQNSPRAAAGHRLLTTATAQTNPKEGNISSVFVSLSGAAKEALPERFADQKKRLIHGNEEAVKKSWDRLLAQLRDEVTTIAQHGPRIIPSINFRDIDDAPAEFHSELRKRGVAVVRGVIPEAEARGYKEEVEAYVRANPQTRAFPPHDPQVFELYWSKPQMRARLHPNMLKTQRFLMSYWHSTDANALISPIQPISCADRLRIRQPGDAGFALGPHVDGGGVERWEDHGYGRGKVYQHIWYGRWKEHGPWEASCRVPAVADNYNGAGACSMFRMFQGWLSMSHTGPREGTFLVNPLLSLASAYYLLRPFFEPVSGPPTTVSLLALDTYLEPTNWRLELRTTSKLEGATPEYARELTELLHPHLQLDKTMIPVPKTAPAIHSVGKIHDGSGDSSVMYIPCCPLTEANAEVPPPDFPGGKGESEHVGRATETDVRGLASQEGLQTLGLMRWDTKQANLQEGQRAVLERANRILGL
ncbi:DUF1479-domain-containing protein [Aspergillus desertorum]